MAISKDSAQPKARNLAPALLFSALLGVALGVSARAATAELDISSLAINLDFSGQEASSLRVSGALALSKDTIFDGAELALQVGGLTRSYTLDATGSAAGLEEGETFTLHLEPGGFSYSLASAALAATFAELGLANADVAAAALTLPVSLTLRTQASAENSFVSYVPGTYTASLNKAGLFAHTAKKTVLGTLSYTDVLGENIANNGSAAPGNQDWLIYIVSSFTVSATANLAAGTTLDENTAFSFSFGQFQFSSTLGTATKLTPGKSAEWVFTDMAYPPNLYRKGTLSAVTAGSLSLTLNKNTLKVALKLNGSGDFLKYGAQNLVLGNIPAPETIPAGTTASALLSLDGQNFNYTVSVAGKTSIKMVLKKDVNPAGQNLEMILQLGKASGKGTANTEE